MIPLLLLAVEGIIVSNALEIIRVEQIDKNRIQTAAILLTGWLMALLQHPSAPATGPLVYPRRRMG